MSKSIKTGEKIVHNFFFMVRFKTKEGAIPFGHTLDTTRPCIKEEIPVFHTKKFVEKCGIEKRGRPCIYPACII